MLILFIYLIAVPGIKPRSQATSENKEIKKRRKIPENFLYNKLLKINIMPAIIVHIVNRKTDWKEEAYPKEEKSLMVNPCLW
jgi:Zn-dependent peptidase ImmA (M78 family)